MESGFSIAYPLLTRDHRCSSHLSEYLEAEGDTDHNRFVESPNHFGRSERPEQKQTSLSMT